MVFAVKSCKHDPRREGSVHASRDGDEEAQRRTYACLLHLLFCTGVDGSPALYTPVILHVPSRHKKSQRGGRLRDQTSRTGLLSLPPERPVGGGVVMRRAG
uniref:Uncharacterized protein n=1 Tax=Knipowitschia caucasica TaxID=637954 RepID=A0AAV2M1E7_KNICA